MIVAIMAVAGSDEKEPAAQATNEITLSAQDAGKTNKAAVAQTICPIMKGEISKTVFADYKGERVYFCCPGCIPAFNEDPVKYIKILKEQGISLDKTPEKSK